MVFPPTRPTSSTTSAGNPRRVKRAEPRAARRGYASRRARALALGVLCALTGSTDTAFAGPSVDIVWIATNGPGTPGGPTIGARPGDALLAEVRLTADATAVRSYSVSLRFDSDLIDELDLSSATGIVPAGYSAIGGNPQSMQESSTSQEGNVLSFAAEKTFAPFLKNASVAIGQVTVKATSNLATGATDVFSGLFDVNADHLLDPNLVDISAAAVFNDASVDLIPPAASVDIVWTETTGMGIPGGSAIQAFLGDLLTAELRLTAGARGVSTYTLSLRFDSDLANELDLISAVGVVPPGMFQIGADSPGSTQESTATQEGNALSFNAGTLESGFSNATEVIGRLRFVATSAAQTDGEDIRSGLFAVGADGIFDNAGEDLSADTDFNRASVDLGTPTFVPTLPATALMALMALLLFAGVYTRLRAQPR